MSFQFEIGKCYQVKTKDQDYPVLDKNGADTGKEKTVLGKTLCFKVIAHGAGEHEGYIRVLNLLKKREHFYHVANTDSFVEVSENVPISVN